MKFLADENIENEIIIALRLSGFEVLSIRETDPGIEDRSVLRIALSSDCILLTNDKDFGELVYRERRIAKGVILLRLGTTPIADRIERLKKVVSDHKSALLNSFSVISRNGLRIRKPYAES